MYRYCLIGLVLLSQAIFTQAVAARMYQWADPETGTTQLSGKPPVWYRSAEGGPRVFVFNRGKVIDDTAIVISDDQRIRLRTKAFITAEEDRLAAKEKAMEAAKLKAAMERNTDATLQEGENSSFLNGAETDPREATVAEEPVAEDLNEAEDSVEKMKALIEEWENKRTDEAKALLQQGMNDT